MNEYLQNVLSTNITIGADPEVFIRHKTRGLVSGHIFRCGTKKKPQKTANGCVQVDGMALEFNTVPSRTADEFVSNIQAVLGDLRQIVEAKGEFVLDPVTTALFGKEYIDRQPKTVRELGCNPDFCAYTMEGNQPPNAELPFRTAAGHVHIGWTNGNLISYEHFEAAGVLVKELDFYLGIPSLEWDHDDKRREMYGKAGCFRPKTYGVEYRVLSNAWVFSQDRCREVFTRAKRACNNIKAGLLLSEDFGDLAREYIDSNGKASLPGAVLETINADY